MSRKYLLPLPRTVGGEGAAKIEDIPPYCTRTLYTGPPGRGQRGSWHILGSLFRSGRGGEGDVTREGGPRGGHSGPGSRSRCLVLGALLAPPPAPVPAQRRPPPWLGLPPPSWPPMAPPWLLGALYCPPSLEGPRGGYGFSETPREPCHSRSRRGRGACGRSSCINVGAGAGLLPITWRAC